MRPTDLQLYRKQIAERRLQQQQAIRDRVKHPVRRQPVPEPPKAVARKTPPSVNPKPPKHGITLQVAQGLGDIFWVYQKFAPHFELINFQICIVNDDPVSRRSEDWFKLMPKIGKVQTYKVSGDEYEQLTAGKFYVRDVISQTRAGKKVFRYCCNKFLEEGIRLEDIDEYSVATDVPIASEEFELPFEEYVTLYISGATKKSFMRNTFNVWGVDGWLDLLQRIYKKQSKQLPVVLIGAEFDKEIMVEAELALKKLKIPVASCVQYDPGKVCHILKNTKLFLGYQSGLNIIADNLDTQQVMIYFKYLEPMQYTWCKKKNIQTLFHSGLFTETPEQVAARLDTLNL